MRLIGSAAALALAASLTVSGTPSAHAEPAPALPAPALAAIGWLQSKVDANGMLPFASSPSLGLTAQFAKGLAELGQPAAAQVAHSVETAAVATLALPNRYTTDIARGAWASSLGASVNTDLAEDLEAHIADGSSSLPTTPDATSVAPSTLGRGWNQDSGPIWTLEEQTWVVLGLRAIESTRLADAVDFLLGQQCSDGGFRSDLSDPSGSNQTCVGEPDSEDQPWLVESNIRATALALIALDGVTGVDVATGGAVTWLLEQQSENGSFPNVIGTADMGVTGVAARALILSGHTAEATKAARWMWGLQVGSFGPCSSPLTSYSGALLEKPETFLAGLVNGLSSTDATWAMFSTTAGFAALALAPTTNPIPTINVPASVRPGGTATVSISGAIAGDNLCVTSNGKHVLLPYGTTTTTVTAPSAPVSSDTMPVTVTTGRGATATVSLKIDTSATLTVRTVRKVRRGKAMKISISGLWPGEAVSIKVGRYTIGSVTATSAGTAVVAAKVSRRTKLGRWSVTVAGAFADRVGSTTFKVVR